MCSRTEVLKLVENAQAKRDRESERVSSINGWVAHLGRGEERLLVKEEEKGEGVCGVRKQRESKVGHLSIMYIVEYGH